MNSRILGAATFAVLGLAGAAHAITVDFSTNNGAALNAGDVLTDFDFGAGLTGAVTANGNSASSPNLAVIFDTNNPSGGDGDLGSDFQPVGGGTGVNFGNALIVQESGMAPFGPDDPDDDGNGGTITFTFDSDALFGAFDLLDVSPGVIVSLFDAGGGLVDSITTTEDADSGNAPPNFFTTVDFGGTAARSFTVDFGDRSGGFGSFEVISAVPLPASLPMLAFGLVCAGAYARRKQRG